MVAIPTANRPELLALTLERLSQALSVSTKQGTKTSADVHIYADAVPESRLREIEIVRDLYLPGAFLFNARPHVAVPSGCWNILNSIKHAARFADEVYLVEEDVLVFPQFFQWHQSQSAAASCGRRHPDPRWVYRNLYTNPGSCLRRPLLDVLLPHINDEYFADTKAYCDKHFFLWDTSTLDDWLIRRVMMKHGLETIYPDAPVCAHIGFRMYNRIDIYMNHEVGIEKKIARAREIMAGVSNTDRYATDFEPY